MALEPEGSCLRILCLEYFSTSGDLSLFCLWLQLWLETAFLVSWRKDLFLEAFLPWLLHGFRLLRRPVCWCPSLADRLQGQAVSRPSGYVCVCKNPSHAQLQKENGKKSQSRICHGAFAVCPWTFIPIGPQRLAAAGTNGLVFSPLLLYF